MLHFLTIDCALTIKVFQSDFVSIAGNGRPLDLGEEGEDLLGGGRVQPLRVGDVEDDNEPALVEGVPVDGHPLLRDTLDVRLLDHLTGLRHKANGSGKNSGVN